MTISKADLLRPRCPEEDVELEGVGTVRVRGLTRGQIVEISKGMNDGKDMEPLSLSWALVDPALTEDEARTLINVAPFGEIQTLTEEINRLSGIAGRADKEAYKSLPDES